MTTLIDPKLADDTHIIGSRIARIDPDNFRSQSGRSDGPFALKDDEDDNVDKEGPDNELLDEDGNPAEMSDHGEHDHHQDDNYALGGHVTRTSGALLQG